MMKTAVLSFVLILSGWITYAQQPDSLWLGQHIDSIISRSLPANAPGGAIAIVSADKVLYEKAFGLMSLEYHLPNTDSTLFNLASVSKHFTAYCILLLEKDGMLNLNDDVRKYLPWLPDYREIVTIGDLVHHTSGIASSDNLRLFAGLPIEAPWDAEDEMEMIARYKQLNYKPNSEGNYSNTGYYLLAKVIEKASGMSFSEFLTQRVLEPLGMKETVLYDSPGKIIPGKATGYKRKNDDYMRMNTEGESVYGSTNLYASVHDMVIWMQHLLNSSPGNQELTTRFFSRSHYLNNGDIMNYSFGLNLRKFKDMNMADHSGYAMGFRSQLMIFPNKQLAIIILTNNESIDNWSLATNVADLYFDRHIAPAHISEKKEIKLPEHILQNYAGNYRLTNGMELNFELKNDTFLLVMPGQPKYIMHAASETDFFVNEFDMKCSFQMGSDGESSEIIWKERNRTPKGVKKAGVNNISASELAKYSGNYFNSPLDITYPVMMRKNQLIMQIPKSFQSFMGIDRDMVLEYMGNDKFLTESLGIIQFTRDHNRSITGFRIVDFGRVKNIRFVKRG
ncbi:MAG TPA: serine hydrolase [Bacteroidales bacterium]|nr:serine hydrolase [Bacteroidales bacterium]